MKASITLSESKKRYIRNKSLGLCARCGNDRDNNTFLCSSCKNYIKTANARSLIKRRKENKCIWCGAARGTHPRYCDEHRLKMLEVQRQQRLRSKMEALNAYGGCFCNCCGEAEIKFLSLDHVNNDGYIHRKALFGKNQFAMLKYSWLRKNGYPTDYALQVLCYNCNLGKKANKGICPHLSKNKEN